jgi:hypothetical protein
VSQDSGQLTSRKSTKGEGGPKCNATVAGEQFIEIDRYGEQLTGCIECNRWGSGQSAFIVELSIEDF